MNKAIDRGAIRASFVSIYGEYGKSLEKKTWREWFYLFRAGWINATIAASSADNADAKQGDEAGLTREDGEPVDEPGTPSRGFANCPLCGVQHDPLEKCFN